MPKFFATPEPSPYVEHFGRGYVDPFDAGAAVAFGLMGMAEAIGNIPSIEACPTCLQAADSWVYGMGHNNWFPAGEKSCFVCYERLRGVHERKHPYR